MKEFRIGSKVISPSHPPYFIAEIGSNHNGDMQLCRRLIDAAQQSGADAVKFQSWSETSLVCRAEYERNLNYSDKKRHFGTLEEMVRAYQFSPAQHREIAAYCKERGITFLSSCFSPAEVELLESLGVPCHKIASMDVNNLPLLRVVAATGTPTIVSTGMATLGEVEQALEIFFEKNCPVMLLHCVALYPPELADVHLNNIPMLRGAFQVEVGFSDHTLSNSCALAAIALGARVVEKHFTVDKEMDGWDHWLSTTPEEFSALVSQAQEVFTALGSSRRTVSEAEIKKRNRFRRSAVLREPLKKGQVIAESNVDYKRGGMGIPPDRVEFAIGRKLAVDKAADEEILWSDIE